MRPAMYVCVCLRQVQQSGGKAAAVVHTLRSRRTQHPSRAAVHSAGLLQHLTARGQPQSLASGAALQLASRGTLSFPAVTEAPGAA